MLRFINNTWKHWPRSNR